MKIILHVLDAVWLDVISRVRSTLPEITISIEDDGPIHVPAPADVRRVPIAPRGTVATVAATRRAYPQPTTTYRVTGNARAMREIVSRLGETNVSRIVAYIAANPDTSQRQMKDDPSLNMKPKAVESAVHQAKTDGYIRAIKHNG